MTSLRLACEAPNHPEIFRSVQGEGPNMGRLRTFVRLSGCNLRCTWCDTAYTWNWIGTPWRHVLDRDDVPYKFDPAEETLTLPVDAVADRILSLPAEGVIITGGEPLIQSEGLVALIARLRRQQPALAIEIETNGTIAPTPALAEAVDLFVVSPKLGHSGNKPRAALRAPVLAAFARLDKAIFKFVAQSAGDVTEVRALAQRFGVEGSRVYIMPEGTSGAVVARIGASLIDSVIEAGFNYSDRLHIHLFGDTRGT